VYFSFALFLFRARSFETLLFEQEQESGTQSQEGVRTQYKTLKIHFKKPHNRAQSQVEALNIKL